MTRITSILCQHPSMTYVGYRKNGRRPQTIEPLKTRPMRDIALKNSVKQKGASESDVVCIKEMMKLFACMEKNEFNESECGAERDAMQNCYSSYLKRKKIREASSSTEPVPGVNKFTKDQLNTLLMRYPQPLKSKK